MIKNNKNNYDRDYRDYFVAISADIYNSKGEKVGQISTTDINDR